MTFNTKTGYGYFLDINDKKVAKFILPIGEHPIKNGYAAVDVADESALNGIVLDEILTPEMIEMRNKYIEIEATRARIRAIASDLGGQVTTIASIRPLLADIIKLIGV